MARALITVIWHFDYSCELIFLKEFVEIKLCATIFYNFPAKNLFVLIICVIFASERMEPVPFGLHYFC